MLNAIKSFFGEVKIPKIFTDVFPGFIFVLSVLILILFDASSDSRSNILNLFSFLEKYASLLVIFSIVSGILISQISRFLFIEMIYKNWLTTEHMLNWFPHLKCLGNLPNDLGKNVYYSRKNYYNGRFFRDSKDTNSITDTHYNYVEISINSIIPLCFFGISIFSFFFISAISVLLSTILLFFCGFFAYGNLKDKTAAFLLGFSYRAYETEQLENYKLQLENSKLELENKTKIINLKTIEIDNTLSKVTFVSHPEGMVIWGKKENEEFFKKIGAITNSQILLKKGRWLFYGEKNGKTHVKTSIEDITKSEEIVFIPCDN